MSNYPFETFPLTKRIGIVNPVANLDARYGPWPTLNDALTGFSPLVRERGLTVAVSGVDGIVEYWYKNGIANNNLVLKSSDITEADILPTVTNYLSTNNVLLSAFTAAAPCVIQTSTTTPALRINQTGSGSALVVEDSTTPDSTPIVIDQYGTLVVGASAYTDSSLQQKGAVFVSSNNTVPSKAIVELRYHGTEGDLASILDFIRLRSNSSTTYSGTFPLSANDVLGLIRMRATTAPGFTIEASVKNSSSTGAISGTRVRFTTHVAQSNSMYNVLTLDENRVGIGTTVPTEALTVVGTISTSQHGTSQQWNSTYNTVCALSAAWEESADIIPTVTNYLSTNNVLISALTIINTASSINSLTVVGNISATGAVYSNPPLQILASNETNLNTNTFTTFVKLITAPNAFTFTNFTSGKTITLYLCAGHLNFSRHYFPQTTYISEAGEGNTVYTFENYITKVTLQNVGTQFIGTTDIIPINIEQIIPVAPIGASIILEDRLGYLKQEDGSYILL